MIEVSYPEPAFRYRDEGGRRLIFDGIRRCWLVLTPEEWVRQNFIAFLLHRCAYPSSFVAVEKELRLNDLRKRFDLLVYDGGHQPWMLVECKAPEVPLTEEVLQQLLRYHLALPVPFLVITNGTHTLAWRKKEGRLVELDRLPDWSRPDAHT